MGERKIDKLIIGSGDEECLIKALDDGDVKLLSKYLAMPKAEELCKRWAPLARETHLTRFFVKYKIPFYLYYSISNAFQESAYDEIKNNPYILVAFFPLARSAWSSIDSIGKQLGISVDSDLRLIGAIEFLLYLELDLGKTAITRDEITERLIKLLKNKRLAVLALQIGIKHRVICSFYASDGSLMVQSLGAAAIESNLATMLRKQAEKGKCRAYVESFTSSSE
ncbi:helix-hairpin-helix domain-containing protein, partial [Idiomarina sp.]|uniref:helix-hairpin-helix domain-containing protein n=1 Tax=Idiomarina sp. TaxID=1874361 RepID=UPI0035177BBC